jgi:cytochrome c-type biogenesis protein CcsB
VVAEWRYRVRAIGMITMPVAIVGVVLMEVLRTEVHPLSPLLQSNWLLVHVTLAILAYATCALSFALAMMFLIQDRVETRIFLALSSASTLAIFAGIVVACLEKWNGLGGTRVEIAGAGGLGISVSRVWLSVAMLLSLAVVALPAVFCAAALRRRSEWIARMANRSVLGAILLQAVWLAVLVRMPEGKAAGSGWFPATLGSSPFVLTGLVGGVLISTLFLLLAWRRADLERLLPSAENLDRITYRAICVAFPLLTLTIATGAYWANQTWGTYWNWDPKETWAAITWLVYALYLHMRITNGWRGRRAAYFAIAGFAVVIFTFFGVTYLLRGLHAFV